MSDDTIRDIEALARKVVEDASAEGVKLDSRVEALKTLAPFYTALKKHQKPGEETPEDNDFNGFRKQIDAANEPQGVTNGTPAVRSRRRGQHG